MPGSLKTDDLHRRQSGADTQAIRTVPRYLICSLRLNHSDYQQFGSKSMENQANHGDKSMESLANRGDNSMESYCMVCLIIYLIVNPMNQEDDFSWEFEPVYPLEPYYNLPNNHDRQTL